MIPCSTLEDFPTGASDQDARSLLAAWTVLWHPALLAETRQLPAWYRADAPPEPPGTRLIAVPTLSLPKLPAGYESRCRESEGCRWITGISRAEMLDRIGVSRQPGESTATGETSSEAGETSSGDRTAGGVTVDDFFALGYAMLQVQVMTRRLRYTSNLDELRLQDRAVAAAEAYIGGDGDAATEALHDAFDLLAEERDHYFASDPSLIDLTLLSPSTVRRWAESLSGAESPDGSESLGGAESPQAPAGDADATENSTEKTGGATEPKGAGIAAAGRRLETPENVLIDVATAAAIGGLPEPLVGHARGAIAGGRFGWAGGGPADDVCLDSLTLVAAERRLQDANRETERHVGKTPAVYARFGGTTPADLTPVLIRLGFAGLIPIDFAGGTGFGDEAKVIRSAGNAEIEALTAKPLDASSDAAFLTIASRLGEAIDSGEIATALIAHWPGGGCDSFHDLRRVASWGLALGRFWKLDAYFREGEHPYHHENVAAVSADAAGRFADRVDHKASEPIQTIAREFCRHVRDEQAAVLRGMTRLAGGDAAARDGSGTQGESDAQGESDGAQSDGGVSSGYRGAAAKFSAAVGCRAAAATGNSSATTGGGRGEEPAGVMIVNPGSVGWRQTVRIGGAAPEPSGFVYGSDRDGRGANVTADVPALGFSVVSSEGRPAKKRRWRWWGGPEPIATGRSLHNEFMEVAIDEPSGGIASVHSGAVRGNRFSMRLVHGDGKATAPTLMRATSCRVVSSSLSLGEIEVGGVLQADGGPVLAEYELVYRLRRGSRLLEVTGRLVPRVDFGGDPWTDAVAARVAVASEATSYRGLVRDKIHRTGGKRFAAPLGVWIDEPDRKTLVASGGLAYHRRVGDRFLDTLLAVRGESDVGFSIAYGFDVRHPVAVARSWIGGTPSVPLASANGGSNAGGAKSGSGIGGPRQGWIMHASPAGLLIPSLDVRRRGDGKWTALVRVVQTRNDGGKVSLRFCRDVAEAVRWDGDQATIENGPSEQDSRLETSGDRIKFTLGGHGILDLLVVFSGD